MISQLTELSNRVRVATCEMPHAQTAAVGIWAGVGGRCEPARKSGISHFIEHLLFKGTKRRTARQISQEVEGVGGYLNAFTAEEQTCYHATAAAEFFPRVFRVLADMYVNPRFAPLDIERERAVITEEIFMYRDEPSHYVHELLNETVWPNHPLGRPLTGTPETVKAMGREDFLGFREKYYHGGNTVVTAAGRIRHEDVVRQVEKLLGELPCGTRARFPKAPAHARQVRMAVMEKDTEQTHLALALPAFGVHDERKYALNLLHILLGANMSSRLFQELREKRGFCYSVSTHVSAFQDTGVLGVSIGLDKRNLAKCLSLMFREFDRVREETVPAAELKRAKDYAIGTSRMAMEKTSSQNNRLGYSALLYGRLMDPEEIHEKIRAVTAEEILAVARNVLQRDHVAISAVGPLTEAELRAALAG